MNLISEGISHGPIFHIRKNVKTGKESKKEITRKEAKELFIKWYENNKY